MCMVLVYMKMQKYAFKLTSVALVIGKCCFWRIPRNFCRTNFHLWLKIFAYSKSTPNSASETYLGTGGERRHSRPGRVGPFLLAHRVVRVQCVQPKPDPPRETYETLTDWPAIFTSRTSRLRHLGELQKSGLRYSTDLCWFFKNRFLQFLDNNF